MALGDALYTITMSASRPTKLTQASFTEQDFNTTASRMAKISNLTYLTKVEVITDDATANPLFLEAYLNNTDEESFLWSMPIVHRSPSGATAPGRNVFDFFQPIRANEVYFGIRPLLPYPDSRTGANTFKDPSSDNWLITVSLFPRNFT